MTTTTKDLVDPELPDLLQHHKAEIFATLNCVKIGKIVTVNVTKKTALVQVLGVRILSDGITAAHYPLLQDVPLMTLQGGGAFLQFPIKPGDNCIVLFSDREIDSWFSTGAAQPPTDPRLHSLTDGIAIVGLNALTSTFPSVPTDRATLGNALASVDVKTDGTVVIGNAVTDLLTALQHLIVALVALTIQDGSATLPVTADSVTALNLVKTELETLLASS